MLTPTTNNNQTFKEICEKFDASVLQQLYKKITDYSGKISDKNVFPVTLVQCVFDAITGMRLDDILSHYNYIHIQYKGSKSATRLAIPIAHRRTNLIIQYTDYNNETIIEQYICNNINDKDWSNDDNWETPFKEGNFIVKVRDQKLQELIGLILREKDVIEIIREVSESTIQDSIDLLNETKEKVDNIEINITNINKNIQNINNNINKEIEDRTNEIQKIEDNYVTKEELNNTIQDIIDEAPEALDTLGKLADALKENDDAIKAINDTLLNKSDKANTYTKTEVDSLISDAIGNIDLDVDSIGTVKSIQVNDETYSPDETGKITLPNYPDAVTIKELVTEPTIIQYIKNYMNKTIIKPAITIKSYITQFYPDSTINHANRVLVSVDGYFFDSVIKDEETVNERNVLDSNGEIINLYKVGFDSTLLEEGECGIIYSKDESFIDNMTLTKFNSITNNSKDLGKLSLITYDTGQVQSDGTTIKYKYFDTESINNILDNERRYYTSYIYIPSHNIFYTQINTYSFKYTRFTNNLETEINYNTIISPNFYNHDHSKYVKFSEPSIVDGAIEYTIELNNLYIVERSTIGLKVASSPDVLRRNDIAPNSTISLKGEIIKLSDNKYKIKIIDGKASNEIAYLGAFLALSPNNFNADAGVYNDTVYRFNYDNTTKSYTWIRKVTKEDFEEMTGLIL